MGVAVMCRKFVLILFSWRNDMEFRHELGLVGTIEDNDDSEANPTEEDSDDEVTVLSLHVCTWKHSRGCGFYTNWRR